MHSFFILVTYPRAILDFIFASASQAKGSARTPTICNCAASDAFPILSVPFSLPLLCLDEEKYIFILDAEYEVSGFRTNIARISETIKEINTKEKTYVS